MPARFAASRSSSSDARREISSRSSSVTYISSWTASRPRKPLSPHALQPAPAFHAAPAGKRAAPPIRSTSSAAGDTGLAQAVQGRRTRRWASTPTSEEAIKNGSTPRSKSRVIVLAASLA